MKIKKKTGKSFERRLKDAMATNESLAKRITGFNPKSRKLPGSRNPKKGLS